ncbi:MAG: hypothetical protein HYX68_20575 [Planctomycetes bacterium]|nr:hypothetical protein [Planctomycetota bacterium]
MGMDQKVIFPSEKTPPWQKLIDLLAARGLLVQMRMIDAELAFPDETPPETWRELRVASSSGMVTLRREPDGITLVIWGNADLPTRQTWNALAWALAHLTGGRIRTATAETSGDEFARAAEMPARW